MKINLTDMDSVVAKLEGKKRQTSIGNVREVRKLVINYLKREVQNGNVEGVATLLGMKKYLNLEAS